MVVGVGFAKSDVAGKDDLGEEGVVADMKLLGVFSIRLAILSLLSVGQGEVKGSVLNRLKLAVNESEALLL